MTVGKSALLWIVLLWIVTAAVKGQTPPAWTTGSYAYDGAGNIRRIGADQFRYDALGRLVSASYGPDQTQAIEYDEYGNVRKMTTNGALKTFGVDAATNRVSQNTASVFATYDAAGRITSTLLNADRFEYDALDAVTRSTVDGVTRVHLYTAAGERLASVTVSNGAETRSEWTLRDASGKVLRRLERNGGAWTWKEDYVYGAGQLLAAENDAGETSHFFPDHLGTPRLITDRRGGQVAVHKYWPFGDEFTSASQDSQKLKFTAHERDAATLDYMHARYYAPRWGRFLSVDPVLDIERSIREPQSWNRYSYVVNNPINRIDPDGRMDGNGLGEPVEWRCPGCTRSEAIAQSNQIAKGTAIGGAVSLAIMAGPAGWRALGGAAMNWIRGNPSAVQNISNAVGAALTPGPGSSFAAGSVTTANSIVKGGKLAGVLGAIEQGAAGAKPASANAALEVVAKAAEAQGLAPGTLVKATEGAAYTLQNAGNVTTDIYQNGRIVVKKGEDVVLDLIQKK